MKTISSFGIAKSCGTLRAAVFGCIGMLGTSFVYADSAPDNKDKSDGDFNNSIELTAGGFSVQGDAGNFHKVTAIAGASNGGDFYGGLESLHIAQDINSRLNFTLDGRAIPEINDYDWKLALTDNKLGYIKAGYSEFRTWYNGNGGFYPSATGTASSSFAPAQSSLSVDRSSVWAEFGLRLENLPEITFRMEHQVRSGDMDSTEWASGNTAATYNYAPAFLQLDEVSDIFKLDLKHTIGNTDFGIALMYERDYNNDAYQTQFSPNTTPGASGDRYLTDQEGYKANIFSSQAFSETHLNDNLTFTAGASYMQSDTNSVASRIYGSSYNPLVTVTYAGVRGSYVGMSGWGDYRDTVMNLNLCWKPVKDLTITPSLRVERETIADGATQYNTGVTGSTVTYTPQTNVGSQNTGVLTEGLDIQYVGINNLSLYASGEWSQVDSDVFQATNLGATGQALYIYDDGVDNDKYALGANWYPLSNLSVSIQGSHRDRYDDPNILPETANSSYSSYYLMQDISQDDAFLRVTWRPLNNLTLVTRYDFERTNISNHVQGATSGSGTILTASEDSADITTHMLSECVTWSPTPKMYIQGSVHFIHSLTNTPANNYSVVNGVPEVVDFQNNYWDGSLAAGYSIDDKTDVQLAYTCFYATNPNTNAPYMGYAANTGEQSLTIGLTRKFSPNLVWSLKYGYFQNRDSTSGGLNNYDAQVVTTTLKYRF